mgnify:CR=1 FL=1
MIFQKMFTAGLCRRSRASFLITIQADNPTAGYDCIPRDRAAAEHTALNVATFNKGTVIKVIALTGHEHAVRGVVATLTNSHSSGPACVLETEVVITRVDMCVGVGRHAVFFPRCIGMGHSPA